MNQLFSKQLLQIQFRGPFNRKYSDLKNNN